MVPHGGGKWRSGRSILMARTRANRRRVSGPLAFHLSLRPLPLSGVSAFRPGPYGNPYLGRGPFRKLEARRRSRGKHPLYFQQVTFRLLACIATCWGVLQERHAINGVTFPEQKGVPRERPFFLPRNNAETPSPVPASIGIEEDELGPPSPRFSTCAGTGVRVAWSVLQSRTLPCWRSA